MGQDEERARSSLRFTLGHTSTPPTSDALLDALPTVVERARRAVPGSGEAGPRRAVRRCRLRCSRALLRSTPVTTSPPCTLALSETCRAPRSGSRGCCSREDARDAARAADVLGIPFYVWDLAERFRADVIDDFVAEYAAGRTPNPCLRCNEKIKFAAVLDRAVALGFDAVVHRASRAAERRGLSAVGRPRQGPVLRARRAHRQSARAHGAPSATRRRTRCRSRTRGVMAVADKPDSHDICFIADGDTAGFLRSRAGLTGGTRRRCAHRCRGGSARWCLCLHGGTATRT